MVKGGHKRCHHLLWTYKLPGMKNELSFLMKNRYFNGPLHIPMFNSSILSSFHRSHGLRSKREYYLTFLEILDLHF